MKSRAKLVVMVDAKTALEITLREDFLNSRFGMDERLLMELVMKELLIEFIGNEENENGNET